MRSEEVIRSVAKEYQRPMHHQIAEYWRQSRARGQLPGALQAPRENRRKCIGDNGARAIDDGKKYLNKKLNFPCDVPVGNLNRFVI
ncbi:hypothetical protein [Pseudomonas asplenii]|uniref:hypothetical protein n=1 Tax=Pseudomonas asplenii TaxID=53407 RepID=UPI0012FB87AE|nr:hypothetical protein [Pseudomonas fuscovaginae]